MRLGFLLLLLGSCFLFVGLPAGATGLYLTTAQAAGTDGDDQYLDGDVFLVDGDAPPKSPSLQVFDEGQFGSAAEVNAFALLLSGNYLLSSSANEVLAGVTANASSLMEWDPVAETASLFLDGSGLPGGGTGNFDAAHLLDNGNLVFSSDADETLWDNGDVVEYNPSGVTVDGLAANAIRILLSESVEFGGENVNVDGISFSSDGDLLLSFSENSVTLGSQTFLDQDILEVNGVGSYSLFFEGDAEMQDTGGDVNGFAFTLQNVVIPEPGTGLLLGLGLFGLCGRRRS
ncbi:MAG: PEP-CTERM sorting domain-containing protein [Deltaproteobacteria bacterium]|nr:PEP-CTERM sorting domain-containing protein [Deltaproteobacteria bacterium]MBW2363204.1 PEP-CTERM sorting domain-containing protein [Deltaproteobacteria bacterium]